MNDSIWGSRLEKGGDGFSSCPLCCKSMCYASCVVRMVEELKQMQELSRRGCEASANSGAQSRFSGEAWEPGHQQQPEPENQGSRHKLNQPRGSVLISVPRMLQHSWIFSPRFPGNFLA